MLSQRQIKAIFAKNRNRGLRSTIQSLRERGHKASDWRTLWHGTKRRSVPSILRSGLQPVINQGRWSPYILDPQRKVYLALPTVAKTFDDGGLLKVRVMKKKLDRPNYKVHKATGMRGFDSFAKFGSETLHSGKVPKSNIRKVIATSRKGKKYVLKDSAINRIQRRSR